MTCNCECHKPGHSMKHAQPCCGDAGDAGEAYSPAPWSVDQTDIDHAHILGAPNRFCADIIADIHRYDLSQGRANARLIAAAPELLEAVKTALDVAALSGPTWLADELRAALSKATGEGASA